MPLTIQDSRILSKTSSVALQVPEVSPSNDHTDGTWDVKDIYKGEFYINTVDGKVYTRVDSGIIEIGKLAGILANGNTTGGNDIVISSADLITDALGDAFINMNDSGETVITNNDSGNIVIRNSFLLTEKDLLIGKSSSYSGRIFIYNSTNANSITIQTGVTSASYTLTLPTAQGSASQVLSNNGSGVLSWVTVAGSGTVNSGTQYRLAYYAATGTAVSEASAITAARVLISDANGVPTHSAYGIAELAPLASPALTGTPTAPTAAANTNSTQIATTAYVDTNVRILATFSAGLISPSDSSTYVFNDFYGVAPQAVSSGQSSRFRFNQSRTITAADISYRNAVTGTNETSTISLKNITDAVDTTLTSTQTFDVGANDSSVNQITGLSISVVSTKDYCIKWVTPAWVTNPTNVIITVKLYGY